MFAQAYTAPPSNIKIVAAAPKQEKQKKFQKSRFDDSEEDSDESEASSRPVSRNFAAPIAPPTAQVSQPPPPIQKEAPPQLPPLGAPAKKPLAFFNQDNDEEDEDESFKPTKKSIIQTSTGGYMNATPSKAADNKQAVEAKKKFNKLFESDDEDY